MCLFAAKKKEPGIFFDSVLKPFSCDDCERERERFYLLDFERCSFVLLHLRSVLVY